jgi:hypothetical protein
MLKGWQRVNTGWDFRLGADISKEWVSRFYPPRPYVRVILERLGEAEPELFFPFNTELPPLKVQTNID